MDRILLDLLTLCRDILSLQLRGSVALINTAGQQQIEKIAAMVEPTRAAAFAAALTEARQRIMRNVNPQYALEAALLQLVS